MGGVGAWLAAGSANLTGDKYKEDHNCSPGTLTNWSEKARLATELADGAAIKLYPTLKSSTFS